MDKGTGPLRSVSPQSMVVLRALQLGDLLCAVPALRALRAAVPRARIELVGLPWARSFAERFDRYLDGFIEFPGWPGFPERKPDIGRLPAFLAEMQRRRFDLAIQMHGSGELANPLIALFGARFSGGFYPAGRWCPDVDRFMEYPRRLHEVRRHLGLVRFLGAQATDEELEFPLGEEDWHALDAVRGARRLQRGPYICIHPGARYPSRRWPAERFAAVADQLAEDGYSIAITGLPWEAALVAEVGSAMRADYVNLCGKTPLGALAALLSGAALLVCNDTGLSHVAAAVKLPSVVIVTGSDADRWAPLDARRHRVVKRTVDCQPCEHFSCPIDHRCAMRVSVELVMEAAHELLASGVEGGRAARSPPAAAGAAHFS